MAAPSDHISFRFIHRNLQGLDCENLKCNEKSGTGCINASLQEVASSSSPGGDKYSMLFSDSMWEFERHRKTLELCTEGGRKLTSEDRVWLQRTMYSVSDTYKKQLPVIQKYIRLSAGNGLIKALIAKEVTWVGPITEDKVHEGILDRSFPLEVLNKAYEHAKEVFDNYFKRPVIGRGDLTLSKGARERITASLEKQRKAQNYFEHSTDYPQFDKFQFFNAVSFSANVFLFEVALCMHGKKGEEYAVKGRFLMGAKFVPKFIISKDKMYIQSSFSRYSIEVPLFAEDLFFLFNHASPGFRGSAETIESVRRGISHILAESKYSPDDEIELKAILSTVDRLIELPKTDRISIQMLEGEKESRKGISDVIRDFKESSWQEETAPFFDGLYRILQELANSDKDIACSLELCKNLNTQSDLSREAVAIRKIPQGKNLGKTLETVRRQIVRISLPLITEILQAVMETVEEEVVTFPRGLVLHERSLGDPIPLFLKNYCVELRKLELQASKAVKESLQFFSEGKRKFSSACGKSRVSYEKEILQELFDQLSIITLNAGILTNIYQKMSVIKRFSDLWNYATKETFEVIGFEELLQKDISSFSLEKLLGKSLRTGGPLNSIAEDIHYHLSSQVANLLGNTSGVLMEAIAALMLRIDDFGTIADSTKPIPSSSLVGHRSRLSTKGLVPFFAGRSDVRDEGVRGGGGGGGGSNRSTEVSYLAEASSFKEEIRRSEDLKGYDVVKLHEVIAQVEKRVKKALKNRGGSFEKEISEKLNIAFMQLRLFAHQYYVVKEGGGDYLSYEELAELLSTAHLTLEQLISSLHLEFHRGSEKPSHNLMKMLREIGFYDLFSDEILEPIKICNYADIFIRQSERIQTSDPSKLFYGENLLKRASLGTLRKNEFMDCFLESVFIGFLELVRVRSRGSVNKDKFLGALEASYESLSKRAPAEGEGQILVINLLNGIEKTHRSLLSLTDLPEVVNCRMFLSRIMYVLKSLDVSNSLDIQRLQIVSYRLIHQAAEELIVHLEQGGRSGTGHNLLDRYTGLGLDLKYFLKEEVDFLKLGGVHNAFRYEETGVAKKSKGKVKGKSTKRIKGKSKSIKTADGFNIVVGAKEGKAYEASLKNLQFGLSTLEKLIEAIQRKKASTKTAFDRRVEVDEGSLSVDGAFGASESKV